MSGFGLISRTNRQKISRFTHGQALVDAPPLSSTTVDHFKCYNVLVAKAPRRQPPYPVFTQTTVTLTDMFRGPVQYDLTKPSKLCLPADKNGENPTAPTDAAHLVCYRAKLTKPYPAQPRLGKRTASTSNQFGNEVLTTPGAYGAILSEVCVPSVRTD
jgi:hypothetical protein